MGEDGIVSYGGNCKNNLEFFCFRKFELFLYDHLEVTSLSFGKVGHFDTLVHVIQSEWISCGER